MILERWLSGLKRTPRKRECSRASGVQLPPSPPKVFQTTKAKLDEIASKNGFTGAKVVMSHFRFISTMEVVIIDGVIVKSRNGKEGVHIGGSLYVWDDEKEIGE